MAEHKVDVVITTTGRPELHRALMSVRQQTSGIGHVFVVLDVPSLRNEVESLLDGERLVLTSGRVGGGAARNVGTDACVSDYVAYLDDDDEWMPSKTEVQMNLMLETRARWSWCGASIVRHSGKTIEVPKSGPPPSMAEIVDYMLQRPSLRYGTGVIQTSCLMVDRETAQSVRWNETLPKHQDWDFVARLSTDHADRPVMLPESAVRIYQGSQASLSRGRNWMSSLQWLDSLANSPSRRVSGDFVATQVLRPALATGSIRGIWTAVRRLVRNPPHFAALIVSLLGIREFFRTVPNK